MPWTASARLLRVQDWLHNTGWTLSYHFVCRLPVSTLQLANQTICLWWSGPHNHESVSSMYISNILSQNRRCHGTQLSTIWFSSKMKINPPPPSHSSSPLSYCLRKAWYSYQSGRLWEFKGLFSQDQMPWSVSYACLLLFHFPTLLEV